LYKFKYIETSKFKIEEKSKHLFKGLDSKELFLRSIKDHINGKFKISHQTDGIITDKGSSYLSFHRSKVDLNKKEFLVNLSDGKKSYLSYDYQIHIDSGFDNIMIPITIESQIKQSKELEEQLFKSGKLEKIEDNLSNGYLYLDNCISKGNHIKDCLNYVHITYGGEIEVIAKLFTRNIF